MDEIDLETRDHALILRVRAKPKASRSRVLGVRAGLLEVSLAAPPVEGRANTELVQTLAGHFGLAKSSVTILSGASSRVKRVSLSGITAQELRRRLGD